MPRFNPQAFPDDPYYSDPECIHCDDQGCDRCCETDHVTFDDLEQINEDIMTGGDIDTSLGSPNDAVHRDEIEAACDLAFDPPDFSKIKEGDKVVLVGTARGAAVGYFGAIDGFYVQFGDEDDDGRHLPWTHIHEDIKSEVVVGHIPRRAQAEKETRQSASLSAGHRQPQEN